MVVETGANDGLRGIPRGDAARRISRRRWIAIKAKRPDAPRRARPDGSAAEPRCRSTPPTFHAVYPAVAKEKGVTLLPFLLDGVAGHRELNQGDGVHPNNAGERIVAENVWRGAEADSRRRRRERKGPSPTALTVRLHVRSKFKGCLAFTRQVFISGELDRYGNSGNPDPPRHGHRVRGRSVPRRRVPSPHAGQPARDGAGEAQEPSHRARASSIASAPPTRSSRRRWKRTISSSCIRVATRTTS